MRFPTISSASSTFLLFLLMFVCASASIAQEENPKHVHVQTVQSDVLKNVVSLVGTKDGKFVYSSSYEAGLLVCYSRNSETGELTQFQTVPEEDEAEDIDEDEGEGEGEGEGAADAGEGAANEDEGKIELVCIDLSQDQKLLVGCSIRQKMLTLFKRDVETGELASLSSITNEQIERGLGYPVTVRFSPDARFVYVANANGGGMLTVFKIVDEQFEFVHAHEGIRGKMNGCRMMCTDPTGLYLYMGCDRAHTIATFDRDEDEGHVRIRNFIEDDSEEASQLAGASGLSCSPDGQFLYVASGRFRGDNAVSAFAIAEDGLLNRVQELVNESELKNFTGGNHVEVSPDGKFVYVSGATSKNLACFSRNADDGTLEFVEYLGINGNSGLGVTSEIYVSADNKFVYVAGEGRKSIYVFQRKNVEEDN